MYKYNYKYKKLNWKHYATGYLSVSRREVVQQWVRRFIHPIPDQQNMFSPAVQFQLFQRQHKMLTQQKSTLTPLCCLCPGCCQPPRNPSRSTWSWSWSPQGWWGSGRFQWRTLLVGQRQQRPLQSFCLYLYLNSCLSWLKMAKASTKFYLLFNLYLCLSLSETSKTLTKLTISLITPFASSLQPCSSRRRSPYKNKNTFCIFVFHFFCILYFCFVQYSSSSSCRYISVGSN